MKSLLELIYIERINDTAAKVSAVEIIHKITIPAKDLKIAHYYIHDHSFYGRPRKDWQNVGVHEAMFQIINFGNNISRVRLFVIFISRYSWYHDDIHDTEPVVPFCEGLMNSCLVLDHDREGKYSINISALADALFQDISAPKYSNVAACQINKNSEVIFVKSLKIFLAPHAQNYIRLKEVFLALLPRHVKELNDLFAENETPECIIQWKNIFEILSTPGHPEDNSSEETELMNLFREGYRPVLELSRWSATVKATMVLVNVNSGEVNPKMLEIRLMALNLIKEYKILIGGGNIEGFVDYLLKKIFKTSG